MKERSRYTPRYVLGGPELELLWNKYLLCLHRRPRGPPSHINNGCAGSPSRGQSRWGVALSNQFNLVSSICICVCVYICMYIYISVCVCVYIYIYVYIVLYRMLFS